MSCFRSQIRTAPLLLTLLLGILGLTASPASAAPPAGDYQQSCRDITVAGTTLSASCRNRGGAFIHTSLTDFPLCIGNIANLDGILSCSKGSPLPGGSYRQSCRDMVMGGGSLHGECRDRSGSWRRTDLADVRHCVGDISNLNGVLRCSRGALPRGSYRNSCADIFVSGNVLEAVCKTRGGSSQGTSLPNFSTCAGEIYNVDGFLTCVRGSQNLPAGNYRDTCRDLSWNGSRLAGLCKSRNGSWASTALNDARPCRGEIFNIDGALSCAQGDDNAPRGSYQETCRDLTLNKGVLSASCRSKQGQWIPTRLSYRSCIGDISNDNGTLRCNPPAPQKPPKPPGGVSRVVLFNCTADRRDLHYWLFDSQGQGQEVGTQASQYDSSGQCPAGGSQAFEIPLTDGHFYRLVVVDPELGSCGANDPNVLACQKWLLELRGAKAGQPWQIIVAP